MKKTTSTFEEKDNQLAEVIESALGKKAENIVLLDVSEVCSFTDHFIICTGTSSRHNQTIADGIEETLRSQGQRPLHIEGRNEGEWILMDYFDFVVHIFLASTREFYDLERLWRSGTKRDLSNWIGQTT